MAFLRAGFAGLAAWLALSWPAHACSTLESYVPPSGFELVEMADAIVIATAIDGTKVDYNQESHVRFRVDSVLKGAPPEQFDSEGYGLVDPKNKDDQEFYGGMCGRSGFTRGHTYVLALSKTPDGDGWREASYLFAGSSQDYAGRNDPWVRTIRDFLDIQKRFAPREQYEELKRLAERLGKPRQSDAIKPEIGQIREHLGTRSEFKPTWYLVETYEQLERGETLHWPWSRRYWEENQAPPPVEQQKQSVLGFLLQKDHPDAAPFFERQLAKAKPSASELGAAILFVARSGDLRRAFDIVAARVAPTLAANPLRESLTLIQFAASAMNGQSMKSGEEAWRGDPLVAAQWPKMAFGFLLYAESELGHGYVPAFFSEVEALRPPTYREWPEWTLAKAHDFDDDLNAWAIAQLNDDNLIASHAAAISDWNEDLATRPPVDPARLPLQVIIRSHVDDRSEILEDQFCRGPVRRRLLIELLGRDASDIYDDVLFKQMLATPSLTVSERDAVTTSLAELLGQLQARGRKTGFWYESQQERWRDLLAIALGNERPDLDAIACPSN